jgi:hypothetical protein
MKVNVSSKKEDIGVIGLEPRKGRRWYKVETHGPVGHLDMRDTEAGDA